MLPFVVEHPGDGRRVPVQDFVGAFLPAVGIELLAHVAVGIHEPHGHQGDPQVAALLEMVPGQKAQAPGVKGQRPVQAVLQGKVSDGMALGAGDVFGEPAHLGLQCPVELIHDGVVVAQVPGVAGRVGEDLLGQDLQELHRVVEAVLPDLPVQPFKQDAGRGVPAPPEVEGQFPQPGDPFGEIGEPLFRVIGVSHGGFPLMDGN